MKINSETEMLDLGRKFAQDLSLPCVIELVGDVGAGKTTFTRGLAEGLAISEPITSPSFMISKRYSFPLRSISHEVDGQKNNHDSSAEAQEKTNYGTLIHYDFYRLPEPGIMQDELTETMQDKNSVVVVEWAESVADLLPESRTQIILELEEDGSRSVVIK